MIGATSLAVAFAVIFGAAASYIAVDHSLRERMDQQLRWFANALAPLSEPRAYDRTSRVAGVLPASFARDWKSMGASRFSTLAEAFSRRLVPARRFGSPHAIG
jgi:hypothetical protein